MILFTLAIVLLLLIIHVIYFDFFFKLKNTKNRYDVIPRISDMDINL